MKNTFRYQVQVGTDKRDEGYHFLIKVLVSTPMTSQACFDSIIQYKRQALSLDHDFSRMPFGEADIESLGKQLDKLGSYNIVYEKITPINSEGVDYYYHQMVIEGEPLREKGVYYDLFHNPSVIEKITPNIPKSVFPFAISAMELSATSRTMASVHMIECLDNKITQLFKQIITKHKENIIGQFETDVSKKYNRNAMIKITCTIYDNLADALNHKNKNTITTCDWGDMNAVSFCHWREKCGVYSFRPIYTTKIKAKYYQDMIVVYDSQRAYDTIKPFFQLLANSGLKNLHIIQFSRNQDFYFSANNGGRHTKLILRFVNVENIIRARSTFGNNVWDNNIGTICIKGHKGQKNMYVEVGLRGDATYRGTIIIPIQGGVVDSALLDAMMHGIVDNNLPKAAYVNKLKGEINPVDDVISTWFDYCIKAKKKGTHDLLGAYVKMKDNLEAEYATLKQYVDAYDFSKCMAIPVVKMDNKLKENYYKTLHMEPKNIIIKSIKKEKINPIELIQPTITFMETSIKKNYIFRAELPLKNYYKAKDNTIELEYKRLKGDVIRAKTQDRR